MVRPTLNLLWGLPLITAALLCPSSGDPFNRTLVILTSDGRVSSVTNITKYPSPISSSNKRIKSNNDRSNSSVQVMEKNITRNCGLPSVRTKLDSIAQFKEWPWHVAIVEAKEDLYICGGSLITSMKILTSAHCIQPYLQASSMGSPKPRLKVRAGEWDVSTNAEALPHVEVLVHKISLHPKFDNGTLENDIGIISLARPILPEFRENVSPVCLPQAAGKISEQSKRSYLKRCVVTGWGRKSQDSEHSIRLKEIVVPLWGNEKCEKELRKHFGAEFKLPSSALCAGDEEQDACEGDGGGPLVCFEDGIWVQEGIVSFGVGCREPDSPGVYTRVSSYLDFINAEL